ncbi:MAG: hypothetical protein H6696_01220 [Deferribacteres bacterium]|nr:hypothetical protein [candidate division KSB1 bacterium]MCB9500529.1 hypothetical protein [Deferribacteres bacterium]
MKKIMSSLLFISTFLISCNLDNSSRQALVEKIGAGVDEIPVIVVEGTPYEMGYQLGKALGNSVEKCISGYLDFAYHYPEIFSDEKLDNTWATLEPYIDSRIKAELKGLAEGSGYPLANLQRAHAIPAIADYACSGVAVWGKASADGHLYQIRNLDFVKQAHLQDYPVVVVYKPQKGKPHTMATFAGYIGAHSGMNAAGIILGEKGESPNSESPFNLDGVHFTFLFRQMLYDAETLSEAVSTIENAHLIKRYFFYVGDGKPETMGAVKFYVSTPDSIKLHKWTDKVESDPSVPGLVPECIYYTMNNELAHKDLNENRGTFNAEKMIDLSKALADEGGNLLNVVYDGTALRMWIAYAEKDADASTRDYVPFELRNYLTGRK